MNLLDLLGTQMGQQAVSSMAGRLGVDEQTAGRAVAIAMPLLIGALARNSANRRGAEDLHGALQRDHDGSLLDSLGAFLQQGDTSDGNGILEHVLGGRRNKVESTVSRSTGLSSDQAGQLFAMLAPLVMAQLGRARAERALDPGGLADLLNNERARIEASPAPTAGRPTAPAGSQASPSGLDQTATSPLGRLAQQLLDKDGDGDITDEAVQLGAGLLGGLLGGRRDPG